MFAIIRTGGKQYKVRAGISFLVEKLPHEAGEKVHFKDVLMIGSENSADFDQTSLSSVEVIAEVQEQIKDKKIIVFKKKRRQNYRRKKGHRQLKTVLQIVDILKSGKSLLEGLPVKTTKKPSKEEEKLPENSKSKAASKKENSKENPKVTAEKKAAPKVKLPKKEVTKKESVKKKETKS
jgi:large subunit ribosomal protein L21